MSEIANTMLATAAAGFWGAAGGFIYWAIPDRPTGTTDFLKRVISGFVVGTVAYAFGGISPFSSAGIWDISALGKLIVAGFSGLAALCTFLPDQLNEKLNNAQKENSGLKTMVVEAAKEKAALEAMKKSVKTDEKVKRAAKSLAITYPTLATHLLED